MVNDGWGNWKKCSDFYEIKNRMVDPTCEYLHRWKLGSNEVSKFRCNDAEENKKIDEMLNLKDLIMNVEFECTTRDAPQNNYLA